MRTIDALAAAAKEVSAGKLLLAFLSSTFLSTYLTKHSPQASCSRSHTMAIITSWLDRDCLVLVT